nr:MmpS family transport accessory protein [uncultured Actinoplanes sp.]
MSGPGGVGPEYPPTTEFPTTPWPEGPVNYAPPGYAPDYGMPDHSASGYRAPGHGGLDHSGHGPGYPPPPYQSAGYPVPDYQPQPQPAPRKSSAPIVAVIVAVTLLLCGGVVTAGILIVRNVADRAKESVAPINNLPTAVPELPGVPTDLPTADGHTVKVTYEVTGDGPAQILYLTKLGDRPTVLDSVKLPWRFSTEVETPVLLSVSATRVDPSEGTITCRALVDGKEVKKNTSASGNIGTTAFCAHLAVD